VSDRVTIRDKKVSGGELRLITVATGSSEFAVIAVQELTSAQEASDPRKPHIGALKTVKTWQEVVLDGEKHTLTLEGVLEDGTTVVLVVHGMSAGFQGSGPHNAVAILTTLRIGERSFLRDIITRPMPGRRDHDSWRTVYGTEVLMPNGPRG